MGLLTKTAPICCPVCGHEGTMTSPRFWIAETISGTCIECGTHLTTVWTGSEYEFLVGHTQGDTHTTKFKESSDGVTYWKRRYGTNWKQARDEWTRNDDIWWKTYMNR